MGESQETYCCCQNQLCMLLWPLYWQSKYIYTYNGEYDCESASGELCQEFLSTTFYYGAFVLVFVAVSH